MRTHLILIVLLAIAVSCSRMENDASGINFIVELDGYVPATKVTPLSTSDMKNTSVGLVAFTQEHRYSPQSSWQAINAAGAVEMRYSQVHGSADPGVWVPNTTIFWPRKNQFIRFFAFAPYDVVTFTMSGTSSSGISAPYIEYSVPEDLALQKDILIAATDALHDNPTMDRMNVTLPFYHALSSIRFRVKKGTQIESVKVAGLYGEGVFTLDEKWHIDTHDTYEYLLDGTLSVEDYVENGITDPNYSILAPQHTVLVLPQRLPETAYIEAYVKEGVSAQTRKVSANLGDIIWEKGYVYIYDITGPLTLVTVTDNESYLKGRDVVLN